MKCKYCGGFFVSGYVGYCWRCSLGLEVDINSYKEFAAGVKERASITDEEIEIIKNIRSGVWTLNKPPRR